MSAMLPTVILAASGVMALLQAPAAISFLVWLTAVLLYLSNWFNNDQ